MPSPRRIIDLSHPLITGQVPTCTGHPSFHASLTSSLPTSPATVHTLTLGTHTGTHLDAPSHFLPSGAPVDALDLSLLAAAPAVIADVRHRGAHERITWADLAPAAAAVARRRARVLLLCTGWSAHWARGEAYRDHPFLDVGAAREVLALGVRVIGVDTLSPDELSRAEGEGGGGGEGADVHRAVLGAGGVIVENLARLEVLLESGWACPTVSLLPLSLAGCDGSPVRAVAWDGTE